MQTKKLSLRAIDNKNTLAKELLEGCECFPAHLRFAETKNKDTVEFQTVSEHCHKTASYAESALKAVGLGASAYLAGLLHDAGKYTQKYKQYLLNAFAGLDVVRGSVNHTFAAVRYLLNNFHDKQNCYNFMISELLAYAVGAHHGLFDLVAQDKKEGFSHRLNAQIEYDEAINNYLGCCADAKELKTRLGAAAKEIEVIFGKSRRLFIADKKHKAFYRGFLARLLLSAVIEGDRRDTAEFCDRMYYNEFTNKNNLWQSCLSFLESKLASFALDTSIQKARAEISRQCRAKAENKGGIFRFNAPTGGGKTLSALRYALAHCAKFNKSRIFYVAPLLSIIDQNSRDIREFLPRQDIVLEHHSNVIRAKEEKGELGKEELLAVNWSAPIIITTLVQFLNTLFIDKTTSIRRFNALCDSVIILDEVQSVPTKMLSIFNLALNFLSEVCGSTILLCSATQPCLEKVEHDLHINSEDLMPYNEALIKPFQRTKLEYVKNSLIKLEEVPQFISERMSENKSVLVVCNTKREAQKLFCQIKNKEWRCFCLSAAMCMAHRKKTLKELQIALLPENLAKQQVLCVSTQVIEAGVNISFECAIRFLAGIDSAVQTAGRCNRHGEHNGISKVYLLAIADENLQNLHEIKMGRDASSKLLAEFVQHPESYKNDLSSDEAVAYYYKSLYRIIKCNNERGLDYSLKDLNTTILDLLTENDKWRTDSSCKFNLQQAFKTAGQEFCVFDNETADVLVSYEKGADIIANLCSKQANDNPNYAKKQLDEGKLYSISLYKYQLDKLRELNGIYSIYNDTVFVLRQNYYNSSVGFTLEPLEIADTEVNACDTLIL